MATAFDGGGEFALMPGTRSGHASRYNFTALRQISAQRFFVFVVDVVDFVFAESTYFATTSFISHDICYASEYSYSLGGRSSYSELSDGLP